MQAGLMFSHRNPPQWRVPWPQLYAQTLERVRFAEQVLPHVRSQELTTHG